MKVIILSENEVLRLREILELQCERVHDYIEEKNETAHPHSGVRLVETRNLLSKVKRASNTLVFHEGMPAHLVIG